MRFRFFVVPLGVFAVVLAAARMQRCLGGVWRRGGRTPWRWP